MDLCFISLVPTPHPAADFQISVTSPAGGEFASAGRTDEASASSNDF
jgi:hypothetical protein